VGWSEIEMETGTEQQNVGENEAIQTGRCSQTRVDGPTRRLAVLSSTRKNKHMRITKLSIRNKTAIVILGAGASRGAKCFEGAMNPAPLDADFFSIMQRVCHLEARLERFLEFVRAEFGSGSCPGMEEMFTQLKRWRASMTA